MKNKKTENYLEYIPVRNFEWYISEETNNVVVERPKFDNVLLKRYLLPYLKKKNFLVKLDEFGSFVWQQIDGEKNVYQICKLMENQFGEKVQPVYDRVSQFVKLMHQQNFVKYEDK